MDLLHVLHGDRYWFKILRDTFLISVHDIMVKVTDLEFLCKSFVLQFLQCKILRNI